MKPHRPLREEMRNPPKVAITLFCSVPNRMLVLGGFRVCIVVEVWENEYV
jgi:hypothetical protein